VSFRTASKGFAQGVVMLALGLALLGGIVFVGWRVGWWFKTQDTQRQDQMYDQSYGRQTALKDQVTKNVALVLAITGQISQGDPADTAPLQAQRKAVVSMVCADAARINPTNPLTGDQAAFVAANCLAGSISPSSPYNN
jgi:hypothetical protein